MRKWMLGFAMVLICTQQVKSGGPDLALVTLGYAGTLGGQADTHYDDEFEILFTLGVSYTQANALDTSKFSEVDKKSYADYLSQVKTYFETGATAQASALAQKTSGSDAWSKASTFFNNTDWTNCITQAQTSQAFYIACESFITTMASNSSNGNEAVLACSLIANKYAGGGNKGCE